MDLGASEAAEIFAEMVQVLGLPVVSTGLQDEPDLVLLDADGHRVLVQITHAPARAPTQVSDLVAREERLATPDALHVLVSDGIPEAARVELRRHGWGWLDLRGHMHLAGRGVFIDAEVPSVTARAARADPFSGAVGLEVACALLRRPGHWPRSS